MTNYRHLLGLATKWSACDIAYSIIIYLLEFMLKRLKTLAKPDSAGELEELEVSCITWMLHLPFMCGAVLSGTGTVR